MHIKLAHSLFLVAVGIKKHYKDIIALEDETIVILDGNFLLRRKPANFVLESRKNETSRFEYLHQVILYTIKPSCGSFGIYCRCSKGQNSSLFYIFLQSCGFVCHLNGNAIRFMLKVKQFLLEPKFKLNFIIKTKHSCSGGLWITSLKRCKKKS